MKNRITALVMAIILVCGLIPMSAQAGGSSTDTYCFASEDNKHFWSAWEPIKEATCTEEGRELRFCYACRFEQTRVTPKAEHDWAWTVNKAPTCSEEGEHTGVCKVCGQTWTGSMAKTAHKWGDWEIVKPATDFSCGVRKHLCMVCGAEETEEFDPDGTLRKGDHGADVKELQQALNSAGYDCGTPDGNYGPKTEAAVKAFEKANGIEGDGVAWPGVQKLLGMAGAMGPEDEPLTTLVLEKIGEIPLDIDENMVIPVKMKLTNNGAHRLKIKQLKAADGDSISKESFMKDGLEPHSSYKFTYTIVTDPKKTGYKDRSVQVIAVDEETGMEYYADQTLHIPSQPAKVIIIPSGGSDIIGAEAYMDISLPPAAWKPKAEYGYGDSIEVYAGAINTGYALHIYDVKLRYELRKNGKKADSGKTGTLFDILKVDDSKFTTVQIPVHAAKLESGDYELVLKYVGTYYGVYGEKLSVETKEISKTVRIRGAEEDGSISLRYEIKDELPYYIENSYVHADLIVTNTGHSDIKAPKIHLSEKYAQDSGLKAPGSIPEETVLKPGESFRLNWSQIVHKSDYEKGTIDAGFAATAVRQSDGATVKSKDIEFSLSTRPLELAEGAQLKLTVNGEKQAWAIGEEVPCTLTLTNTTGKKIVDSFLFATGDNMNKAMIYNMGGGIFGSYLKKGQAVANGADGTIEDTFTVPEEFSEWESFALRWCVLVRLEDGTYRHTNEAGMKFPIGQEEPEQPEQPEPEPVTSDKLVLSGGIVDKQASYHEGDTLWYDFILTNTSGEALKYYTVNMNLFNDETGWPADSLSGSYLPANASRHLHGSITMNDADDYGKETLMRVTALAKTPEGEDVTASPRNEFFNYTMADTEAYASHGKITLTVDVGKDAALTGLYGDGETVSAYVEMTYAGKGYPGSMVIWYADDYAPDDWKPVETTEIALNEAGVPCVTGSIDITADSEHAIDGECRFTFIGYASEQDEEDMSMTSNKVKAGLPLYGLEETTQTGGETQEGQLELKYILLDPPKEAYKDGEEVSIWVSLIWHGSGEPYEMRAGYSASQDVDSLTPIVSSAEKPIKDGILSDVAVFTLHAEDAVEGKCVFDLYGLAKETEASEYVTAGPKTLSFPLDQGGYGPDMKSLELPDEVDISVDMKSVKPDAYKAGQEIKVQGEVTNSGSVPVTLTDLTGGSTDIISAEPWMDAPLEAGKTYAFTLTVIPDEDVTTYIQTAVKASAEAAESGENVTAGDGVWIYGVQEGAEISLAADDTEGLSLKLGESALIKLKVTNTGEKMLAVGSLAATQAYGKSVPLYDGYEIPAEHKLSFAKGESFEIAYTVSADPNDVSCGVIERTLVLNAHAVENGEPVSDTVTLLIKLTKDKTQVKEEKKEEKKPYIPSVKAHPDCCVIAETQDGTRTVKTELCDAHIAAQAEADALLEAVSGGDYIARTDAWQRIAMLWLDDMYEEYEVRIAQADAEQGKAIREEEEFFVKYLACREETMSTLLPNDPLTAAETLAELIRERTLRLCAEQDASLAAAPYIPADADPDAALCASKTVEEGIVKDIACPLHEQAEKAAAALFEGAETAEEVADAWRYAKSLWLAELTRATDTLTAGTDAGTAARLRMDLAAYVSWIRAYEAELRLLSGDEAYVLSRVTETVRARVWELCGQAE